MAPPARRTPPLLVMAAAGLVVVLGAGVLLIATRGQDREVGHHEEPRFAPESAPVATSGKQDPSASERDDQGTTRPNASKSAAGTAMTSGTETGGAAREELPVWARPPRVTAQPFPEGARFDPPMPPVKIPPEMLVPPVAPDATSGGAP